MRQNKRCLTLHAAAAIMQRSGPSSDAVSYYLGDTLFKCISVG
jgi:hypothetical protein